MTALIPLFTEAQIQERVQQLGAEIDADYVAGSPLHFVGVLSGAFVFLSDLARTMPRPVTLDFLALSSYGAATKRSGELQLVKDLDIPLHGQNVIIVVDIVNTGLTLSYLSALLRARSPISLKTACLFRKPSRCKVDVIPDYTGFQIEDVFVVGYGLDHSGEHRHLPFIAIREDTHSKQQALRRDHQGFRP